MEPDKARAASIQTAAHPQAEIEERDRALAARNMALDDKHRALEAITRSFIWQVYSYFRCIIYGFINYLQKACWDLPLFGNQRIRKEAKSIVESGLFNASFYLETNRDVAAGMDPLMHYLRHGAAEGRDPNPLFDTDWYLGTNRDVAAAGMNPLVHYLRHGAAEGRDPSPLFDTDWYLETNRDVAAAGMNPLVHYLRHGAAEGRKPAPPSLRQQEFLMPVEIQKKRETVIEAYEHLKYIEPILQHISLDQFSTMLVTSANQVRSSYFPALRKFFLSLDHSYERIIFVPWLTYGGADLEAIHALRAAQERHGIESVLLVVTDYDRLPAEHWLPDRTHMRVLSHFDPELSHEDRAQIVKTIIHSLQPKTVLNVNSRACWDVFARYGAPLSHATQLYSMLFCYDYFPDGRMGGYAVEYFRTCLPHLTKIYSDNVSIWGELCKIYGVLGRYLPKLVALYQPWESPPPRADLKVFTSPSKDGRFHILWAGRICRQKNPQLLLEIARHCPGYVFDVYGICEKEFEHIMTKDAPPNVNLKGPYSDFEAIPVGSYDAFLYTSLWDGLPNVLIKVATLNIPVVASGLDGIVELIDEATGWPVMHYQDVGGYIRALEEISDDPLGARMKVKNLYECVMTRHSWRNYLETFSQSPSFID